MCRLGLAFLLTLICALPTVAEQPFTRLYTVEDGLVRSWVTRIRPDRQGRLWFCTVEGLSLFDGERFSNYTPAQGLPHGVVNDILDAGDASYWLATGGGLYRFRPRTTSPPKFDHVPLEGGPGNSNVNVLLRDHQGVLWFGTDAGLYRVLSTGGTRGEALPLGVPGESGRSFPTITALVEDSRGRLWIGTGWGLLYYRNGPVHRLPTPCSQDPHAMVRTLKLDQAGNLWVGFQAGIARLNLADDPPKVETACFDPLHPLARVHSFHEARNGDFWIGAFGLARLKRDSQRPLCEMSGNASRHAKSRGCSIALRSALKRLESFDRNALLGSQYVSDIAEDTSGNLWVALSNNGVMRILPSVFGQFTEADGLESKRVHSVFEGQDGTLYAVTGARHTLNQFEDGRFHPINPRTPPTIASFGSGEHAVALQDRLGEWWVATSDGLLRYPKLKAATELSRTLPLALYAKSSGLPSNDVGRLYECRNGDIWVAAGGVSRWSRLTGRIEDFTARLSEMFEAPVALQSLAEDRDENVWVGLYPRGLARFRKGHWEAIRDGSPSGTITSLLIDRAGRLWVGSASSGVTRIDEPTAKMPRFNWYLGRDRLRSSHVVQLAEDSIGRIYIAGGRGVDCLDPATDAVTNYSEGTGLPPGETRILYRDRHGAMWFGSGHGLSRYVVERDPAGPPVPPVVHEVRISGVPALVSDKGETVIHLPPFPASNSSIEIYFGSVDFSVGHRVRYKYRLLPVDAAWQSPSSRRSVQYAGLGPNHYRFEIQAVGVSGTPSDTVAAVSFQAQAPFWKTWWFLLLAGALATAIACSAQLYHIRNRLGVERLRSRLAADLHDDLGSGLAEIAILSEVAAHREPKLGLEAVAQRARELRAAVSDIVWSIDPAEGTLDGLINRWRQTAFALLGDDRLEFVASPNSQTASVVLAPDQLRELLLVFKEMTANVAHHAGAKRVWISVQLESKRLLLTVRDDGCGFDTEQAHPGNGLKNMQIRAVALGAKLVVSSKREAGTIVSLNVPLALNRMTMQLSPPSELH